jgi:uncharacterized oligopeptide transporter (OPT) family protein
MTTTPMPLSEAAPRWTWLPAPGTPKYYALLGVVGILILGPLGGVAAAYMNFSLGFFIGGQVLAGILGSTVTFGYGAAGRHGANYIQTAAASVAGMSGMAVVIQAMAWLGLPQPPIWQLMLYMLCIGMFGVGVGMLYTPILVDRLQLSFPSGLAVANILRALTDPILLRKSVSRLFGGIALGIAGGIGAEKVAPLGAINLSSSTFGAGMIVGARIGIAAIVGGFAGWAMIPYFVSIGWLQPGDPFRKITFLIALGMIMGAALIDVSLILFQAYRRAREGGAKEEEPEDWKRTNTQRLVVWVLFWGAAIVVVGSQVLDQPVGYLIMAVLLVFIFAMVNGISVGMVDQNPISSAFVVTVILMAAVGLRQPIVGLIAATVLLVSTSEACDMQQDRSTGWRLGTNRTIQFRFQVAGIVMGAIMAVVFCQAVHERLSGAVAGPDGAVRRPAARSMGLGDDLQVRRHPEEHDRREALSTHGDLDRHPDRVHDGAPAQDHQVARPISSVRAIGTGRPQHRFSAGCGGTAFALCFVVRRLPESADHRVVRGGWRPFQLREQPAQAQG